MIQKFVLRNRVLETESEKRKVILGAYLIVIYLFVDFFFFIINLFNSEGNPASLLFGVIVSIICLLLMRWQYINTAIVIHLLRCNVLAFYFSLIDENAVLTGSYLYFIPSSLGALAVFGYRERWAGIGFSLLSYVLFIIAIFKPANFHPNDPHFYLIVSFLIIIMIGILILFFFDQMVTRSEKNILQKNKELTKANQELDRFVYSASHDLRAPLTSMSGLVQLAQRDLTDTPTYLSLMEERVKVMDNYIKDIVEYSRNARLELNLARVSLKPIIEEVINTLKYSTDVSKVLIEIKMDDFLKINTDESRLRVILNNLIGNAFKYQDLKKPNPHLKVQASLKNNQCLIKIDDNGMGIPPEHHIKIFDMFYRANDLTPGSGLGLYIARETADKLNGKISFESVYGEGTTFVISIPA
jgi:signal transduction histidine kinase